MDQLDSNFSAFLSNPFTQYFLHLLEASSSANLDLAGDPTQDLPTSKTMKILGYAQGTKHLSTLIESEREYINDKPNK